jgi:CRP-like cAMP-binding protein
MTGGPGATFTDPSPSDRSTHGDPAFDWFGTDIPAEARSILAELGHVRQYAPGDVLFRAGDDAVELGILRRGRVALRVLVPERGETTIQTVDPGDVVAWSAVVPPYRCTSTAVAIEPVELVAWEGAALRGILRSDCRLASIVYPRLLAAVARRLLGTREQLLDLFARDAGALW